MTVDPNLASPRRCPSCNARVFKVGGRLVNNGGTVHRCWGRCPECGSTRIRHDERPASHGQRMIATRCRECEYLIDVGEA
jgi:hypothetical protein